MADTYTIKTTKGSETGSMERVCAWQAEMQGGAATITRHRDELEVDVSDIDFDADDVGATLFAVTEALEGQRITGARETSDGWAAICEAGQWWWPNEEAAAEIAASEDPRATVMRMARNEPNRGRWNC